MTFETISQQVCGSWKLYVYLQKEFVCFFEEGFIVTLYS